VFLPEGSMRPETPMVGLRGLGWVGSCETSPRRNRPQVQEDLVATIIAKHIGVSAEEGLVSHYRANPGTNV
jgi:hypothetical protein